MFGHLPAFSSQKLGGCDRTFFLLFCRWETRKLFNARGALRILNDYLVTLLNYEKQHFPGKKKTETPGMRSKMAPGNVLSLSNTWSSHKRERQNTLRVVFSNAALRKSLSGDFAADEGSTL